MQLTRYDSALSTSETNELLDEVASQLLDQLHDQALASQFREFIRKGDYLSVCEYTPNYSNIHVTDAWSLRQVQAFYSKRVDLELGFNVDDVAMNKFMEAEELCRESNTVFMAWRQGRFYFEPDVDRVFYLASRKIADVLGPVPSLSDLKFRFGPGATTNVKKQEACPRIKLRQTLACSEELSGIVEILSEELPGWFDVWARDTGEASVQIHDGVLSFVPKSFKGSRCIVTEPVLNSFVQLGIGDYITERLRSIGLDLSKQEQKNKSLAMMASLTGDLATLDLSSASDTISKGIVEHLLPPDWVDLLSSTRTGSVRLPDGRTLFLNKFSSMGNGFTFPLETLIFYALAWACCESRKNLVNCYGDDLIVPVEYVGLVRKVLRSAGFLLNGDKSYWEGPFRESCGGDYLKGIDIRPVYVKDRISCYDAFRIHNAFVNRWQHDIAAHFENIIAPHVRIYGPKGYGDGHLIGPWTPKFIKRNGYGGATFDTYRFIGRKIRLRTDPGDAVLPAYTIYASSNTEVDSELTGVFAKLPKSHGTLREVVDTQFRVRKNPESDDDWLYSVSVPGTKGYARRDRKSVV